MRIALVGFGAVGQALVRLLAQRQDRLYARYGLRPRLVGVMDSRGAALSDRGLDAEALLRVKQESGAVSALPGHGVSDGTRAELIADSNADVLIEASPSVIHDPAAALQHMKVAFRNGMHVIAVNKAPLAVALPALLELAEYNRVAFRFSGTVGAGTPVLSWAAECARGDEIVAIRAILNGTTNFILWRMHESGEDFDAALAEAVRLGYAESDPSADIDGVDTATKVVILANVILGRAVTIDDVAVEGIRGITRERIESAAAHNRRLKLVGELAEGLQTAPLEVEAASPLDVPRNLNAVSLTLRHAGDVTLIGRGAGGTETATAVLRDLIDIWCGIRGEA